MDAPLDVAEPPDLTLAPEPLFWRRDLRLGTFRKLVALADDEERLLEAVRQRIRSRAALSIIEDAVGLDGLGSIAERQEEIAYFPIPVAHFLLVDAFCAYKNGTAVSDVAEAFLDEATLESCRRADGTYTRQLLLFHLYLTAPGALRYVLGLNTWHRRGSAPMVLAEEPAEEPDAELADFLDEETLAPILDDFRRSRPDHPRLHHEMVIPRQDDGQLLFLRRNLRPDYNFTDDGEEIQHGNKTEWIILHFHDDGRAVRITSQTSTIPRQVADRIASGFFGAECHYVDDDRAVDENLVRDFIDALLDPLHPSGMQILEVVVENSPLPGGHKLMITNSGQTDVIDGIDGFEEMVGELFDNLDNLFRIKVGYADHRLSVFFPKRNGIRVVEYGDSRMDDNRCREFEHFMVDKFGLEVRSTEAKGRKR